LRSRRTDYARLVKFLSTVDLSYLVDLTVDNAVKNFYAVLYRLFDERVPLSYKKRALHGLPANYLKNNYTL